MNRLVLIGNGFDLAHGLKTSYADFINWYWEQRVNGFRGNLTNVSDDPFCMFEINDNDIRCWNVFAFYLPRFINKPLGKDVIQLIMEDTSRFKVTLSPFFEKVINSIETKGWVDIENEYYSMLVNAEKQYVYWDGQNQYQILNKQLDFLREKLVEYLKKENKKDVVMIEGIKGKIYCPIKKNDLSVTNRNAFFDGISWGKDEFEPSNIMLLNFNYTNTAQRYIEGSSNTTINYIHGCLENPTSVIFGYGDELDEDFHRLKKLNDNECLRHVKSINYLEFDNYKKMLEFIESDSFQIVIMGHSCGNSDRTLLNTIFEHPNCVSIKPYYYINEKLGDNYLELVQNIYRNFTDLKLMRDRVVNKTYTEPLTKITV